MYVILRDNYFPWAGDRHSGRPHFPCPDHCPAPLETDPPSSCYLVLWELTFTLRSRTLLVMSCIFGFNNYLWIHIYWLQTLQGEALPFFTSPHPPLGPNHTKTHVHCASGIRRIVLLSWAMKLWFHFLSCPVLCFLFPRVVSFRGLLSFLYVYHRFIPKPSLKWCGAQYSQMC